MPQSFNFPRRRVFMQMLASGAFGAAGASFIRSALAAEPVFAQGVQRSEGKVTVNGQAVRPGAPAGPGDRVSTDKGSYAIVVLQDNAFLLRENTTVEFGGKGQAGSPTAHFLRLVSGKLLSVFGKGDKRILTPTATAGIRGTALYLEVEPDRTYLCLCYGTMELNAVGQESKKEIITTSHHGDPRYVTSTGAIERAPVVNHTDAELFLLEETVGRVPAFTGMNTGTYY